MANAEQGIDGRINRLLDQLENPTLSAAEVDKLQEKIAFLQSMK